MCAIRIVIAMAACVIALLHPAAALCAVDGPEPVVLVHVHSVSGEPIPARILVVGTSRGQSYQKIADPTGETRFSLPAGRYWLTCESAGYERIRQVIDLQAGGEHEVSFSLVKVRLIGSVRSKSDVTVTSARQNSVARRLSRDLVEALDTIGGLSARAGANGLGARVSLEGADESLARMSLGGAPIPANAAALALNTDLVQTVQIDQSRELVRFIGLGATQTPTVRARARSGSYGSAFESLSFQDTLGSTGLAMMHTLRAESSPANGATYLDASGASYRHIGAIHTTGDYIKADGPLGSYAGSVEMSLSRGRGSPLRTYFAGTLPAGTGPGESTENIAYNSVLTFNGAAASNSIALTYAEVQSTARDRQANRITDGSAFPFALTNRSGVQTFSASLERATSGGLTLSGGLQAFNESAVSEFAGTLNRVDDRLSEISVAVRGQDSQTSGWTAEYRGGHVDGRFYGSASAHWRRRLNDRMNVAGAMSAGSIPQQGNGVRQARGWLDPYEADFDCADRIIVTEGPGETASTPQQYRIFGSAGWDLGATRLAASAWYTRTRNQLLSAALVPLRSDDVTLPGGYVDQLLQEASSRLRCGTAGSYALFARQDVAHVGTTNRGVTVSLVRDIGPQHAELTVEFITSRLDTLAGQLQAPLSVYIPGRQLPGIPPVRATLLLDRMIGRRTEMLSSIHYESANNAYNLPSFVVTAVGISRQLSTRASLSLVAGNVFGAYAGSFVSPRYAMPVATESGTALRGVASPLAPLRVSAQLDWSTDKR